jgi:hypothetical protein
MNEDILCDFSRADDRDMGISQQIGEIWTSWGVARALFGHRAYFSPYNNFTETTSRKQGQSDVRFLHLILSTPIHSSLYSVSYMLCAV